MTLIKNVILSCPLGRLFLSHRFWYAFDAEIAERIVDIAEFKEALQCDHVNFIPSSVLSQLPRRPFSENQIFVQCDQWYRFPPSFILPPFFAYRNS